MNEPKVMQELHKLREKNYEETKHLSPEERLKIITDGAAEVKKRILERRAKKG